MQFRHEKRKKGFGTFLRPGTLRIVYNMVRSREDILLLLKIIRSNRGWDESQAILLKCLSLRSIRKSLRYGSCRIQSLSSYSISGIIARVAVRWIFSRRIFPVSQSRGNHAGAAYEIRDLTLEQKNLVSPCWFIPKIKNSNKSETSLSNAKTYTFALSLLGLAGNCVTWFIGFNPEPYVHVKSFFFSMVS